MATANAALIAALIGPVHGIAWLFGVITTWRDPRRTTGIVVLAVIPGIGGMFALRALGGARRRPFPGSELSPSQHEAGETGDLFGVPYRRVED
jgi:hypothetical protein